MDHFSTSSYEPTPGEQQVSSPAVIYPPKFRKTEQRANAWLRTIGSLALYLILGYYIFHSFQMLILITVIVIFHEMGHFLAMKYYGYSDLGIFFIPLLGAYVSGSKREVSQKESAVILLAGPIPGVLVGILFYIVHWQNPDFTISGLYAYNISLLFVFLNLVNLLPVYPLDGGQLLNRIFLDEESWVSKVFVFLSIGLMIWFVLFGMEKPLYPLLIFPAMMLFRLRGDTQYNETDKKIDEQGINADTSYEELSDEDYWKIRNILIESHSSFKDIQPAPPYEYSPKEEKVMSAIQNLLHRHLIQDISVAGKILVVVIWGLALSSPWLLKMDLSYFAWLGF